MKNEKEKKRRKKETLGREGRKKGVFKGMKEYLRKKVRTEDYIGEGIGRKDEKSGKDGGMKRKGKSKERRI